MKLIIEDNIRSKYPSLRIGIVVAENVSNSEKNAELDDYCKKQYVAFRGRIGTDRDLAAEKNIVAWQTIYRSFGVNPKKKSPTAEALLSRVVRTGFVPCISPAVDSYLVAETKHCLPIGGYDLERITGDIHLRYSRGGEQFQGIGSVDAEITNEGEVIYSDDSRILTRRWNYRDCDHAKISSSTLRLALFVEAPLEEIATSEVEDTLNEIEANLQKYCGGRTKKVFLGVDDNEIEL